MLALELGADDYLTKPFSHRELLARLRAVWRRIARHAHTESGRRAHFSDWWVDVGQHLLIDHEGAVVRLTAGEYGLLRVFLHHPQRLLTRQDLLHHTRHNGEDVFDRSIDVLVARLRRKLRDNFEQPAILQTIRGSGYRFVPPVTWVDA